MGSDNKPFVEFERHYQQGYSNDVHVVLAIATQFVLNPSCISDVKFTKKRLQQHSQSCIDARKFRRSIIHLVYAY